MLKSLSTAGLGAVQTLEELMNLAAQNGFDAIDCPTDWVLQAVAEKGMTAVRDAFAQHHLVPGAAGMPTSWGEEIPQETFLRTLEDAHSTLETMRQVGCRVCTTYLMPGCNGEVAAWQETAAARIAQMDRVANEHGLRFGVEYVAPKHLIARYAHPFVHTAAEMLALIAQSGTKAGLLLDSLHWFAAEETVSTLLSLKPEQIVHVHVNDSAHAIPIDNDRLYPGEGIIPLRDFLGALQQIGYSGCVALEVLAPNPPTDSPSVLARRAAEGFAKVWPH